MNTISGMNIHSFITGSTEGPYIGDRVWVVVGIKVIPVTLLISPDFCDRSLNGRLSRTMSKRMDKQAVMIADV